MSQMAATPEGLLGGQGQGQDSDYAAAAVATAASSSSFFPATYSRVEHLGRQARPQESIMTILGRQTEEPYLSRILLDACLRVYNEKHPIGKFVLDLTDALDQSSCEIARGHALYSEHVEFNWWEPEPLGFVVWAVARPRHLIAKYKLLKREFEAILVDCETEATCGGSGSGSGSGSGRGGGSSSCRCPGYEPSASIYFQMLASEPARDFLLELKAWTADMRAFIVDEVSKGGKHSADLSRLRQVRPGR